MKVINNLVLFLAMVSFASCGESIKTEQELKQYISDTDNGLKQEKNIGDATVSCMYWPQVLNSKLSNEKSSGAQEGDKLYFIIDFSREGQELLKQLEYNLYSEMVQVLSFRMSQYITLQVKGSEPMEPLDCLFQQTYGMSSANTLMVVFEKEKALTNSSFTVEVKEFGLGIGKQIFRFDSNKIKKIENIKI